jgi:hypothetical protein
VKQRKQTARTETIAAIKIALLTSTEAAIVIRTLASVTARAAGSNVCLRIGNAVVHATDTDAETYGTAPAGGTGWKDRSLRSRRNSADLCLCLCSKGFWCRHHMLFGTLDSCSKIRNRRRRCCLCSCCHKHRSYRRRTRS